MIVRGAPWFGALACKVLRMTVERLRARVFGEVAGEYDRIRPGYPDQLFDDVIAYAALGSRQALEVGAGTGKATR